MRKRKVDNDISEPAASLENKQSLEDKARVGKAWRTSARPKVKAEIKKNEMEKFMASLPDKNKKAFKELIESSDSVHTEYEKRHENNLKKIEDGLKKIKELNQIKQLVPVVKRMRLS